MLYIIIYFIIQVVYMNCISLYSHKIFLRVSFIYFLIATLHNLPYEPPPPTSTSSIKSPTHSLTQNIHTIQYTHHTHYFNVSSKLFTSHTSVLTTPSPTPMNTHLFKVALRVHVYSLIIPIQSIIPSFL